MKYKSLSYYRIGSVLILRPELSIVSSLCGRGWETRKGELVGRRAVIDLSRPVFSCTASLAQT